MRKLSSWNHLELRITAAGLLGCALLFSGCAGEDSSTDEEMPAGAAEASPAPGGGSDAHVLQKGDRGPEVEALYLYLQRYGYFPSEELAARYEGWEPAIDETPADLQVFDDVLEKGVRLFQRTMGLPEDGTLNRATAELMATPRHCSHPDLYTGPPRKATKEDGSDDFVYAGSKWGAPFVLSYRFDSMTADLPASAVKAAFRRSFDRWSAVSPLVFGETGGAADMVIQFGYLDGPGGYSAFGWFPPNGDMLFDDDVTWNTTGPTKDLESYAMHEIGHAIGLDHSFYGTIMYAYDVFQRDLDIDDIQGSEFMYGKGNAYFIWSQAGAIPGKFCTLINEPADPHMWSDNYLCSHTNYGIVWSNAGPVGGMRCTQMNEAAEPAAHTWSDNYICVPKSSSLYFTWSTAGPIAGKTCTQIYEFGDPHTWKDNHLCYQFM